MKKIFIVFMVILLLSLTILPSFAEEYDWTDDRIYISYFGVYQVFVNGLRFNRSTGYISFEPSLTFSFYNRDIFYIYVNGVYSQTIDLSENDITLDFSPGDIVLISPTNDFSFFTVSGVSSVYYFNSSGTYILTPDFDTYYIPVSFTSDDVLIISDVGYFNLNGSLVYSDGDTDFYDSSVTDYVFTEPYTLYTSYTSFVGNLWHSFEWLGDLTTSYSGLFIFIGGILAVLFVVFLFVFFFKRFGGV